MTTKTKLKLKLEKKLQLTLEHIYEGILELHKACRKIETRIKSRHKAVKHGNYKMTQINRLVPLIELLKNNDQQ